MVLVHKSYSDLQSEITENLVYPCSSIRTKRIKEKKNSKRFIQNPIKRVQNLFEFQSDPQIKNDIGRNPNQNIVTKWKKYEKRSRQKQKKRLKIKEQTEYTFSLSQGIKTSFIENSDHKQVKQTIQKDLWSFYL